MASPWRPFRIHEAGLGSFPVAGQGFTYLLGCACPIKLPLPIGSNNAVTRNADINPPRMSTATRASNARRR